MSVLPERWFTPAQAAELLQVDRHQIYAAVKTGRLRAARIGGCIRISDIALAEMLGATNEEVKP